LAETSAENSVTNKKGDKQAMSSFNKSNEMASELVFGRTYQGNEPTLKPERLVFVKGDSTAVVAAKEETHAEWAEVANIIHSLFHDGYDLGCDINVSWTGRYDANGDPEPDNNYLPCRKPVSVRLDGRHLCAQHDPTDYKAKWEAAIRSGSVEDLRAKLETE
jgi:hypothetical protein